MNEFNLQPAPINQINLPEPTLHQVIEIISGKMGADGAQGKPGLQGPPGDKGEPGRDGLPGAPGRDGKDGREIKLRKTAMAIEYQYSGDSLWSTLMSLSELGLDDKVDKSHLTDTQAHKLATTSQAGFMSPEDKQKLDSLQPQAPLSQQLRATAAGLEARNGDTWELIIPAATFAQYAGGQPPSPPPPPLSPTSIRNYLYIPDYKPKAEIKKMITDVVTPKGKFWGVIWENFRFEADGSVQFIDESVSGGNNLGFSATNKQLIQQVADNIIINVSGSIDGGSGGVAKMMADSGKRTAAIDRIMQHINDNNFAGVSLNFEPIPDLRDAVLANFKLFVRELRIRLGSKLMTWAGHLVWDSAVTGKPYSNANYTGYPTKPGESYLQFTLKDLDQLGFDIIEMQAYDQFYDFGLREFGITSEDQVRDSIDYATSEGIKNKLGIIIANYAVRMNDGDEVYGAGLNLNNGTRSQVKAIDPTYYTTATRHKSKYLLKSVGGKQIMAADQQTVDAYYNICKQKDVKYVGWWLGGDYDFPDKF